MLLQLRPDRLSTIIARRKVNQRFGVSPRHGSALQWLSPLLCDSVRYLPLPIPLTVVSGAAHALLSQLNTCAACTTYE